MRRHPARRAVLLGLASLPLAAHAAWPERSLREFGAIGDGQTDDTAAFQRAIAEGGSQLYVPEGRYIVRQSLFLRSGQTWRGAGANRSILATPQEPALAPFNLLTSQGPISDLEITDIGFEGSLRAQTAPTPAAFLQRGQQPFALYLRAGLEKFALRRCRIEGFGMPDKKSGGGIAIGPLPRSLPLPTRSILIQDCSFINNGNVPGVYIAGNIGGGGNIQVLGCHFTGIGGDAPPQNAVYILGTVDSPLRNIQIADCRFSVETPLDTGVELNWIEEFNVGDLVMRFKAGATKAVGVLLRDGVRNGRLSNILIETEVGNTFALALVGFAEPPNAPIEAINISKVTTIGPFERAISIDLGSRDVLLTHWRVSANDFGGPVQGLRFAACNDVTVHEGEIVGARHPIRFAATSNGVELAQVHLEDCGGGGFLIDREAADTRADDLKLTDLTVSRPRPGTEGVIDAALGAAP